MRRRAKYFGLVGTMATLLTVLPATIVCEVPDLDDLFDDVDIDIRYHDSHCHGCDDDWWDDWDDDWDDDWSFDFFGWW